MPEVRQDPFVKFPYQSILVSLNKFVKKELDTNENYGLHPARRRERRWQRL